MTDRDDPTIPRQHPLCAAGQRLHFICTEILTRCNNPDTEGDPRVAVEWFTDAVRDANDVIALTIANHLTDSVSARRLPAPRWREPRKPGGA